MKNEKKSEKLVQTSDKNAKQSLAGLSKEEVLKILFDKPVSKIKEGGHAKYSR